MTPQLMQSIRLLQLTHLDLERFVDQEIESNPLLARDEEPGDDAPPPVAEDDDPAHSGGEAGWLETGAQPSAIQISNRLDTTLENVFPDDPGGRDEIAPDLAAQWRSAPGSGTSQASGEGFDIDRMVAAPVTLRDHVTEQIAFAFRDPQDRLIAANLADCLDEAGYLQAGFESMCQRLGVTDRRRRDVLEICQSFEPAGLFARTLGECPGLQLARRDRYDPEMQALVAHLDLLARRDFQTLKRLCGVEEDDLLDMMDEIRALDPKPGSVFSGGTADTIVPDVSVRPAADGSWTIELNPEALPRVLVDRAYYTRVTDGALSPKEKEFLSGCLQQANWLTRSLDQRARTILKVSSEIVRLQDGFLIHGVSHLKPLNLRTVADAIGMHESTVSRVTANKYMATPRGVFELRYFFTAAIGSSEGGDAHSSEAVRHRIKLMIGAEVANSVLSDDTIADRLKAEGIDIARRTVAKYREGMNIPSSVQRRREKKALAEANR
jgi:RNA polymerase sigma-54 factor